MKLALPALALLAAAVAAPALAADDPILAKLAGDWTGTGTYRQNASAQPERIFCRITNTLVQGGKALQQRGRCSVASNSGSVDGMITAEGGGRYSGSLDSLASVGPASLSGSGSGNRLVLSSTFVDTVTKEQAQAETTMQVSGDGYRVTTVRKDGGPTWTGSDISFKPK